MIGAMLLFVGTLAATSIASIETTTLGLQCQTGSTALDNVRHVEQNVAMIVQMKELFDIIVIAGITLAGMTWIAKL